MNNHLSWIYTDKLRENLSVSALINEAVKSGDGQLASNGCLVVNTGKYTGRSPNDRYIVLDEVSKDTVAWGKINHPLSEEVYCALKNHVQAYVADREMFLVKSRAGADPQSSVRINIFCESPAQAVFANQIFIKDRARDAQAAEFTVIAVPGLKARGAADGINSEAFIVISLKEKLILIAGTRYMGEIKKSIFSVMNYLLPGQGILPMHCSCNMDEKGNTALFFGLSGTGKTTLSADPKRRLIGDDEHGWDDHGVFNLEGGCYAKMINLDPAKEREIFNALKFGSILENVVLNQDGDPDYSDGSLTENTRGTYPLEYISNADLSGQGGEPRTIIFLTADAFGVLPPIARLTREGAMYHFMSGYTSKLAGTERGIVSPQVTFSSLFGEPFMPRSIPTYARLMGQKIAKHTTDVYLINTGWTGGKYGVGSRIPLKHTRKMVEAALNGSLKHADYVHDDIFNLDVPTAIKDVPYWILNPKSQWHDQVLYTKTALDLAEKFKENFKKFPDAGDDIVEAGPKGL